MIIIPPKRETLATIYNNRDYKDTFLGGVNNTNLPLSIENEWVVGTYAFEDVVKIEALKGEYISLKSGNTAYPHNSEDWLNLNTNDYRFRNGTPSSQSSHTQDITIEYDMSTSNFIAGFSIEGVNNILIEKIDNNEVLTEITQIDMLEVLFFSCIGCCDEYRVADKFFYSFPSCGEIARIKVTFQGSGIVPRKIGVVGVGRQYDMGCLKVGANVGFTSNNTYKIEEGNLSFKGGNNIITISGVASIKTEDVSKLSKILNENANRLNFYIVDDTTIDIGNMIGSHQDLAFPYSKNEFTSYSLKVQGTNK